MNPPAATPRPLVSLARAIAVLVLVLYGSQLATVISSAGRFVGIDLESDAEGLIIDAVDEGSAGATGLMAGDRVLAIAGVAVDDLDDYDRQARRFFRGRSVVFLVLREGRMTTTPVVPGTAVDWRIPVANGLLICACLALARLLSRRWDDLRARLMCWLLLLVALDLSLPWDAIGVVGLTVVAETLYRASAGAQIAIQLHLASILPSRSAWLNRRPWLLTATYRVSAGLAVVAILVFLLTHVWEVLPLLPLALSPDVWLLDILLPTGAVIATLILLRTALRHPLRRGRAQAGLVLLGMVPWTIQNVWSTAIDYGAAPSANLELLYSAGVLFFAVAVFVAIFRYRLFDIELVVRRGLLYTVLSVLMISVLYGVLAVGGTSASRRLVPNLSSGVWMLCAMTFLLGLLFDPLRRLLQRLIDRSVFPERGALRGQLIALARELPGFGKLPKMSRHLTSQVRSTFGAKTAALFLADPVSGLLTTLVSKPDASSSTSEVPTFFSPEDPAIDQLRRAGRPRTPAELGPISPELREQLKSLQASLLVPLLSQDQLVGILVLGPANDGRYPAEEKELLHLLAQHAATVFENVRLFESATYESLTGLLRREAVLEVLGQEIERARRYERPLTVALADLDHFKRINDRYGHLTGDLVLQRVAAELSSGLRTTDSVGRYGGEEFLLILPETSIERATVVAEDIRHRISAMRVAIDGGIEVSVRISIGLTSFDQIPADAADPVRSMISRADRALYRAKGAGRDRVETGAVDADVVAQVRAEVAARRRDLGENVRRSRS